MNGPRRPRTPHPAVSDFLDVPIVSVDPLADDLTQRIADAARVIEAGFRGDAGPLGAYRRQLTWVARLLKVPLAAERLAALAVPARAGGRAGRAGRGGEEEGWSDENHGSASAGVSKGPRPIFPSQNSG